jgi:hypothetical protein
MAKIPTNRRVASNPHHSPKGKTTPMTEAKKKAFVARMKKARNAANPSNKSTAAKKKKPAATKPARKNPTHAKRRNPNLLADPRGMMINIGTALLSAVATRQLPQMILKEKNTSWMGYLANVGAGIAATFAAAEFISADAGRAAMLGSGVIVLDRVLTEKFSPVGQYLSLTGLGDATAATSLGTVADGYYIHPTIYQADGQPIIPHEITDAAVREFARLAPPAAPAARPAMPHQAQLAGAPRNRFVSRIN